MFLTDQIWSITPWVYSLHYWFIFYNSHGRIHHRLTLVTVLMVLWGIRLTYNFWRRGGYGNLIIHEEDYRWPILRKKMNPILFVVFNFTFIATYQNFLLWLIATPAYVVLQYKSHKLNILDYICAAMFLLFLFMETVADEQQYRFQTYKHSLSAEARRSHPNPDVRVVLLLIRY
jgi:steroid 5-alpha reductase family enzyme